MDFGLQGKVAIVTGSSDGIGYATAHALAQEGVRVVLCARREALLAEARDTIAKETGAELLAVPCDVQQLPDVQRLVTATIQCFGAIHILVNNAGSVPSHAVHRCGRCEVASNVGGETAQLHPSDPRGRASYAEGPLGADYQYRRNRPDGSLAIRRWQLV